MSYSLSSKTSRRIFAVADVHADKVENLHAIKLWSKSNYRNDALLVAGDVTDSLTLLSEVLVFFTKIFREVFFVPGNHELWVKEEHGSTQTSLQKFTRILGVCREIGVKTLPSKFILNDDTLNKNSYIWIVPLLSWYTTPEEDACDTLYTNHPSLNEDIEKVKLLWMDLHNCVWPDMYDTYPAEYFCDMNYDIISQYHDLGCDFHPVITFSHFMPRSDLLVPNDNELQAHRKERLQRGFDSEFPNNQGAPSFFNFSRFAGCKRLDQQIRGVGSSVHFYGHQHRNRDRIIDGVHYISHSLGYGRERDAGLIWGLDQSLSPKQIWPPLIT